MSAWLTGRRLAPEEQDRLSKLRSARRLDAAFFPVIDREQLTFEEGERCSDTSNQAAAETS